MTYEEIVEKVRSIYENADARMVFEHVAIQINIEGEGEGILYMEVANRQISVEPYDYYDRDGMIVCTGDVIFEIAEGKLTVREAVVQGRMQFYGNLEKFRLLEKIVPRS